MIYNPILPGFHPDPCICRKGNDYYLAVSTFEWFPGIPVYRSRDLKNWELYTHVLTDDQNPDLRKLPSAKGIWAPCLTYCEEDDLFYVVYGVMNSMNARCFDVNNYLITSRDMRGPWSEPVYLHSAGFDASLFHDDDGRKYVVSLEWETREGYEKPGAICLAEYDPKSKTIVEYPRRIWNGGTDRGCIEGPHLYKRNGKYYLMCAEGGTGYNHCVTMARSTNIFGDYEGDPENPIITSVPWPSDERADSDHLKPKYFNPGSLLQKSGHGSWIETPDGEQYVVHLTARPFAPELRCTLGRETAIQKMKWTDDGWLRMMDGSRLAKECVEESSLMDHPFANPPARDEFEASTLIMGYYAPRINPTSFTDLEARPGWLRMRGQESLCSLNEVSLMAKKLTSVYGTVITKMEFEPEIYQHSAGLVIYYDNMDYVFLRKYYSETLGGAALSLTSVENGKRVEHTNARILAPDGEIWMKLVVSGRQFHFEWSADGKEFQKIGMEFDTTKLSDEYCEYGEFTGTFVGMACVDQMFHRKYADFDYFEYVTSE